MDSVTRKLANSIREYLDDVTGRQHLPLKQETIDEMNALLTTLEQDDPTDEAEASPGERQAAEASGALHSEVKLDAEASQSPGEKAAAAAAATSAK